MVKLRYSIPVEDSREKFSTGYIISEIRDTFPSPFIKVERKRNSIKILSSTENILITDISGFGYKIKISPGKKVRKVTSNSFKKVEYLISEDRELLYLKAPGLYEVLYEDLTFYRSMAYRIYENKNSNIWVTQNLIFQDEKGYTSSYSSKGISIKIESPEASSIEVVAEKTLGVLQISENVFTILPFIYNKKVFHRTDIVSKKRMVSIGKDLTLKQVGLGFLLEAESKESSLIVIDEPKITKVKIEKRVQEKPFYITGKNHSVYCYTSNSMESNKRLIAVNQITSSIWAINLCGSPVEEYEAFTISGEVLEIKEWDGYGYISSEKKIYVVLK